MCPFKKVSVHNNDEVVIPAAAPVQVEKPKLAADSEERRKERIRISLEAARSSDGLKSYFEKEIKFFCRFHPELQYEERIANKPGFFGPVILDAELGVVINAERYSITQQEKEDIDSIPIRFYKVNGDLSLCCSKEAGLESMPERVSGSCTLLVPGLTLNEIEDKFSSLLKENISIKE